MSKETPPEDMSGRKAVEQAARKPQAFPAAHRIRHRPEFLNVYEHGERVRARLMTVMAVRNTRDYSRLGIAATRKLGGAVVRNRAKRLVRELFRRADVPAGLDIVVIPRSDMLDAEFRTVESELRYAMRRLGRSARPDR
jgi:ribonuclease P protein component